MILDVNDNVQIFGIGCLFFLCMMILKCLIFVMFCLVTSLFIKESILSVLLCLEALVVLCVVLMVLHSELLFSVCFVSVGACESAVGLSCLVNLVRAQGSDRFHL